jgi:hypothetical protein
MPAGLEDAERGHAVVWMDHVNSGLPDVTYTLEAGAVETGTVFDALRAVLQKASSVDVKPTAECLSACGRSPRSFFFLTPEELSKLKAPPAAGHEFRIYTWMAPGEPRVIAEVRWAAGYSRGKVYTIPDADYDAFVKAFAPVLSASRRAAAARPGGG